MKYQLSTLLLLILVAAVSLGWYVDHVDRNRRDIIGTWHYPTPDFTVVGYGTSLVIRPDGTFTKTQSGRSSTETFDGTYSVDKEGRVVFHVESKLVQTDLDAILPEERDPERLDSAYELRCAVDKSGYLIVADVDSIRRKLEGTNGESGIRWERTFKRK
jgi:hypothetical protein